MLPRVEPVTAPGGGGAGCGRPEPGIGAAPGLAGATLDASAAELEIDGLRAYREGSPASRIHWPTVARRGEMLERRLVAELDSAPLVVLDRSSPAGEEALDAAVRAAGVALRAPGARERLRRCCFRATAARWRSGTTWAPGRRVHVRLALVEPGAAAARGGAGAARRGGALGHRRRPAGRPARARAAARRGALRGRADARWPAARRRSRWPAAPAAVLGRGRPEGGGVSGALAAAAAGRRRRRPGGCRRPAAAPARDSLPLRLACFAALAAFGAAPLGRARGRRARWAARSSMVAAVTAGAAVLGAAGRAPGSPRARFSRWRALATARDARGGAGGRGPASSRLLGPRGWDELGDGLDRGLEGIQTVDWPYAGPDEWIRLTILLGAPLLLVAAAALAFFPVAPRRARAAAGRARAAARALRHRGDRARPGRAAAARLRAAPARRRLAVAAAAEPPRGARRAAAVVAVGGILAVPVAAVARRRAALVGLPRLEAGSAAAGR